MKAKIGRIISLFLMLAILTSIFALTGIVAFANSTNNGSGEFIGQPLGEDDLETASNATKNESGELSAPIKNGAPQITFLIPGYDSLASVWSNNYYRGMHYNEGENKNEFYIPSYCQHNIVNSLFAYINSLDDLI